MIEKLHSLQEGTVWKNEKSSLTEKKFRQTNYLLVISLASKTIALTKFLRKKCEREFRESNVFAKDS